MTLHPPAVALLGGVMGWPVSRFTENWLDGLKFSSTRSRAEAVGAAASEKIFYTRRESLLTYFGEEAI